MNKNPRGGGVSERLDRAGVCSGHSDFLTPPFLFAWSLLPLNVVAILKDG